MNTKVSIITPCYNAERYIAETIESVIAQTYTNWELLITDDCSTDNSRDIIKWYTEKDNRIKLFCLEENSGVANARNNSIKEATGRYIAFLDSDDYWYPIKLEEQIKFMQDNNFEFICSYFEYADCDMKSVYCRKLPAKISYRRLLKGLDIGLCGVVVDIDNIGKKYMPNMTNAEDWTYWLCLLKDIDFLHTLPKVTWKYRKVGGQGLSKNKIKQLKGVLEGYKLSLNIGTFKACLYVMFMYIPYLLLRKLILQ
jgi:teichuronic acid biosynthesis glycosyltransferase TuaG